MGVKKAGPSKAHESRTSCRHSKLVYGIFQSQKLHFLRTCRNAPIAVLLGDVRRLADNNH